MPVDGASLFVRREDSKAQLAESGLTAGWLVEMLVRRNPEFKHALGDGRVEKVVTNDISEGEGYASRVYKVTLRLTNANAHEYAVIMKVPTSAKLGKLQEELSEQMKDGVTDGMKEFWENGDVSHAHNVECAFYEAVVGVEGFPLPKVWYTRQTNKDGPGVILMEDLSAVGCKTGFMQAMTAQQLRNITRHFAALHAYHICADESQRKRIETVPSKCTFLSDDNESTFEGLLAGIREARENPLAELLRKLKPASSSVFMQYVLFDRPKELGIPPLMCQGDSGGHNVFFKKAEQGALFDEVCALLDWQAAFKGNPFYDIAKYVVGFSDADVRRELETDLVEDYYAHFKEGVENKGGKVNFGLEQLHEAYELCKAHSALITLGFISFLPVLAVNKMSPEELDTLREIALLRAKFALSDAVDSLKKYAPQYLSE